MTLLWILGLLALGVLLLWLARRGRARSGLPEGRVIYTDTGGWRRPERALFSRDLLLTGRPDYLVDEGREIIPVEVKPSTHSVEDKSSSAPKQPYDSHIIQLAAYCLLVEEEYGRRPPYGIIKYADRAFEIDYTPGMENELLSTLEDMRSDLAAGSASRNHDEPRRCQACGHLHQCRQRLA